MLYRDLFWGQAGSGIMFVCSEDKTVLLLRRAGWVGQGGTWSIPGGALGEGYFWNDDPDIPDFSLLDFAKNAIREVIEELGSFPETKYLDLTTYSSGNWRYVTFIVNITKAEKERWTPTLVFKDKEHVEAGWFLGNELPTPLHFGVSYTLRTATKLPEGLNSFPFGVGYLREVDCEDHDRKADRGHRRAAGRTSDDAGTPQPVPQPGGLRVRFLPGSSPDQRRRDPSRGGLSGRQAQRDPAGPFPHPPAARNRAAGDEQPRGLSRAGSQGQARQVERLPRCPEATQPAQGPPKVPGTYQAATRTFPASRRSSPRGRT